VQASTANTLGAHQSNLAGTWQLREAARPAHRAQRFIYASSAAVYGQPAESPPREDSALNPLSPYAIDKLAGGFYLRLYLWADNSRLSQRFRARAWTPPCRTD